MPALLGLDAEVLTSRTIFQGQPFGASQFLKPHAGCRTVVGIEGLDRNRGRSGLAGRPRKEDHAQNQKDRSNIHVVCSLYVSNPSCGTQKSRETLAAMTSGSIK